MLDLEKYLRELEKKGQEISIRWTGRLSVSKSNENIKKVKKAGKKELKTAKKDIAKANGGLSDTVKGQFGNRITEILEEQAKMLDNF